MNWTTALPDWESRIVKSESLIPFEPLYPEQASRALDIFGSLKMVDAAGSPYMSDAVLPWVNGFVGAIFGAYNHEEGRRVVNEFLLLISKKNGKSTIAAGIMLTALILNWRQSGEFLILAPTKEVADNSYKPIRDMIAADEELHAIFQVQDHIRTVTHRTSKSTLKVVAADSDTVSGKKAIGIFIDELHEFGKQPKAGNMLLEATGGLASRPEGFVIYATTQSENPPAGVFKEKLDYARKVRDGKIVDKSFLPVLYEFPDYMLKKGMHKNLENAYVTNPNWGVSVDIPFMQKKHMQGMEGGESAMLAFLSKHLNVEIGLNLRSDRWAGADWWEAQGTAPGLTLESLLERCEVVDVGIDGGGMDDLLGLAVVGRDKVTRGWLLWTKAWAHPSVLTRRKEIAARLKDFADQGDLVLVQNIGDDVYQVAEIVAQCEASGLLDKIGCDPAGLGSILEAMIEQNVPENKVIGISQGWKMTGALKTTERKLAEGALQHGGQPMMAWCVGNAKIEPRGNAIIITKQASGTAKIDPLMATFNAITLMSLNPESIGNINEFLRNPVFS